MTLSSVGQSTIVKNVVWLYRSVSGMCHDGKVYFHELKLNLFVCVYMFCVIGYCSPRQIQAESLSWIFWVSEPIIFC